MAPCASRAREAGAGARGRGGGREQPQDEQQRDEREGTHGRRSGRGRSPGRPPRRLQRTGGQPPARACRGTIAAVAETPSERIDARIEELGDWRGELLSRIRNLVKEADPEVVEEWKWRGVPVWEHAGILCTGETYKNVVKVTFHKGASLEDPSGLFNSSLEGSTRRAIDLHEGETIDEAALKGLVPAAGALNESKRRR